jgi:hypothetical protein
MAAFSFAYNPFVILPVSLRASSRDVEEAFARRIAARPQDEVALRRARTLLLEPDSRLASEVAWLIDVGPREAVGLLGAMAGGDQAALLAALANQPPLTRANVAADACARLKSPAFIGPVAAAHRALDMAALTRIINEIHADIPMPPVAARQLDAAVRALTMLHAGAAMSAISAQPDPHATFAAISAGPDAAAGAFMTELAAQYHAQFPPQPEEIGQTEPEPATESQGVPAEPVAEAWLAAPKPIQVRSPELEHHGWGEGEAAAAAASAAFMDAQLVFTAPERFDTWGNSRRVRRVLYVLGGALAAVTLIYLMVGKGPSDNSANNQVADPPPMYTAQVGATEAPRHHKRECITVSGGSYCTH